MSPKKKIQDNINKFVERMSAALTKFEAELPVEAVPLTTGDKRHAARARKGGDRVITSLAEIAKTHDLDSNALSSEEMMGHQTNASALAPLLAQLTKLTKRVSDAQYSESNLAWTQGLQFYALLQRRALTDGEVAEALTPIISFFNYRHPTVADQKPTKLATRAASKLRDAERLVARTKPRAATLEQEHNAPVQQPAAPAASQPATTSVATPAPSPVVVITTPSPAPVVASPSVIATPVPAPSVAAVTNGASNGVVNGASSGAAT